MHPVFMQLDIDSQVNVNLLDLQVKYKSQHIINCSTKDK